MSKAKHDKHHELHSAIAQLRQENLRLHAQNTVLQERFACMRSTLVAIDVAADRALRIAEDIKTHAACLAAKRVGA